VLLTLTGLHGMTFPIRFSKVDLRRVPDHWLTFGSRVSPLSASPRLAVNPANAILNYLYAILESETVWLQRLLDSIQPSVSYTRTLNGATI